MDKNYNVDDILLDIKSKKSRQREQQLLEESAAEAPEAFPTLKREKAPPVEEEPRSIPLFDGEEPPVRAEPAPPRAKRKAPPPPPQEETGAFVFPERVEEKPNPLGFEGEVQSITDRARMRKQRSRLREELQREQEEVREAREAPPPKPQPEARRGDTTVIDFSAFRAGVMEAVDEEDEGRTRVLPKLDASRELDLEALRSRQPTVLGVDEEEMGEFEVYDDDEDDDSYYDDADDELHQPAIDFSEYNSVEDRRDVAIDIARVKLWLVIRMLVTGILAGILFYLVLSGKHINLSLPAFIAPERDLRAYFMSLTVVTVGVCLAGSSAMGGGLISLFKMRANSDTLVSLAMLAAVGQCVFATAKPSAVNPKDLTMYCCVAALGMFFNSLGKMTMISRIQANFKIIASDRPKKAVLLSEDDVFSRQFVPGSRHPLVAVSARTDFFTDFLALSYSDQYDVGIHRVVAPICLLCAVIAGIFTYLFSQGDAMAAVTSLTAILCVASTFSATFIENVPLGKLTRKLAPQGGMVSGNKAVEDYCDVSAIVLSESDLFPAGNVQIHGIKPFEGGRVDEAIVDVASVVYAAGSAMSSVFLEMLGGNKGLLKPVENIVYEDGQGICAWVASRRVLMGNRQMMMAHGIQLPEEPFDQRYTQEGGEVFYLAVGGEACARFLVSYHIDEALAAELDRLAAMEKTLVIYTMDPNLTPQKIWSLYNYPESLIQVVPAQLHERYQQLTLPRKEVVAKIAYTGRASAMVGAIRACVQARSSILSATILQLIQITLGYGLVSLVGYLGAMPTLPVTVLAAYQFFWFVVIWLVQKLRAA